MKKIQYSKEKAAVMALANLRLEGLEPSDRACELMREVVEGRLTTEQAIQKIKEEPFFS